jgi:hypothetical protein
MTINEIKEDIDFLCGSTSATYLVADKIRNINTAYQDVARTIWESAGDWQYDDTNVSTIPFATTTLVSGQQDYELPATTQRVQRVEVYSGGTWNKLKQIDIHDVTTPLEEYRSGTGQPAVYDIVGRSVILYPAPDSGQMKVYVDRDVSLFSVSSTTESPGFATPFHRILSYSASIDFMQDDKQREFLIYQKDRLEKGLSRFYSKRNVERKTSIRPSSKKYWRQYT